MLKKKKYIFPILGAEKDLKFIRLSGWGLGNCFFSYFHALILNKNLGITIIEPAWLNLKIGTFIRNEQFKRTYWGIFNKIDTQITGIQKLFLLLTKKKKKINLPEDYSKVENIIDFDGIFYSTNTNFTFDGLHEHREYIREHFINELINKSIKNINWGMEEYIAIHVRMGDFSIPPQNANELKNNQRAPLEWYAAIIKKLIKLFPNLPIIIVSDANKDDLDLLISLGGVIKQGNDEIDDIMTLAGSKILIGSNSTFSEWSAFLGNQVTVWPKQIGHNRKPTTNSQQFYLDLINPKLDTLDSIII